MKPLRVGCLALLLFLAGCGKKEEEKYLAWDFEQVDSTTLKAICVEFFPNDPSQKVDNGLCSHLKHIEGLKSQHIHCQPLPEDVWTGCDPQFIEMMVEGGNLHPNSGEGGNGEYKAFYCGFLKIAGNVLPGCPDDRFLGWSLVQKTPTTFIGVCAETLPDYTERIVDRKLCRNKGFPIARAKMLGNRFFNCKPEDHYVWTNCNPNPLQLLREEAEMQKRMGILK